jgi:hypothetical protein
MAMTVKVAEELHKLGLVGGFEKQFGGISHWDDGALDTPFARALMKDAASYARLMLSLGAEFHYPGPPAKYLIDITVFC